MEKNELRQKRAARPAATTAKKSAARPAAKKPTAAHSSAGRHAAGKSRPAAGAHAAGATHKSAGAHAGNARAKARKAAARRARRQRLMIIGALAILCVLALGVALFLHLQGRDRPVDAAQPDVREQAELPERPEAEQPVWELPTDPPVAKGEALPEATPEAIATQESELQPVGDTAALPETAPDAAPTEAPVAEALTFDEVLASEAEPAATEAAATAEAPRVVFDMDGNAVVLAATPEPEPEVIAEAEPSVEPEVIAEAEPEAEPAGEALVDAPAATARAFRAMGEIIESARPDAKAYKYQQKTVANGSAVSEYKRETPVAMPASADYAQVDGVLTFRGNNYRDTGAFGLVPENASGLSIAWTKQIGGIEKWTGVGWTGQASIVRWPEATRQIMNLNAEKKAKDGLKEVIYGTLDGHIYFLDLEDGQETRSSIAVPSSIKGSVSVDPRGYPLLYCGQGIPEVNGTAVKIGTRVFSLINQETLFFLNGRDDHCLRRWYAFDCSPLVDAASDTLLQLGENGIFYSVSLNTDYDPAAGTISVDPVVDRMIYKSAVSTRMGMENSLAVYDHYAYYTDNSGLLTCLDLNTLEAVWLGDVGDDCDASTVIEEDEDGVWLYNNCELDLNGLSGDVYLRRFNALTGEEMWRVPVKCRRGSDSIDAGGFATPTLGKGSLGDYVYFNISYVAEGGGTLFCVNKKSGEVVWTRGTGGYSWSSPVCLYDASGRGYFIFGNAKGIVRLCDGLTGEDIASIDLGANIEGSPAVFDDMFVIGTRGGKIYGVKITN